MKKLISSLVVSVVLAFSGAAVLGESTEGCNGVTVAGVFTDIDTACIAADLAASVIPPGVVTSVVAQDVADVCGLVQALLPDVEAVIVAFEGKVAPSAADAGTLMFSAKGTTYQQPAWALPKIAAARAKRLAAAH